MHVGGKESMFSVNILESYILGAMFIALTLKTRLFLSIETSFCISFPINIYTNSTIKYYFNLKEKQLYSSRCY